MHIDHKRMKIASKEKATVKIPLSVTKAVRTLIIVLIAAATLIFLNPVKSDSETTCAAAIEQSTVYNPENGPVEGTTKYSIDIQSTVQTDITNS